MRNNPRITTKRVPIALAGILTLTFFLLALVHVDLSDTFLLTRADRLWLDVKHRIRGARIPGQETIIVNVDASSDVAALVTKLSQADAKAIGVGFHLSEHDLAQVNSMRARAALGVSLRSGDGMEPKWPFEDSDPEAFGFLNIEPDRDGLVRAQPQMIEYAGRPFPSIDIQVLRKYLSAATLMVEYGTNGMIRTVQVGGHSVPADSLGRMIVDHSGPRGTYKTVSMVDVIEDRIRSDVFKDKIVLVGTTAQGLANVVHTPFDPALPATEFHANIVDNILHQRFLYRRHYLEGVIDLGIIFLFGIVLGTFLPNWSIRPAILLSILMLAGFVVFNYWAFVRLHWFLSLAYPGLSLAVTSFSLIFYRYWTEEREGLRNKRTFHNYLNPYMAEQMMNSSARINLNGEKRELSVLFSDIRGFTSSSEKMAPSEVVQFLSLYFEEMQSIIWRNKGTLDKLIGDEVMSFWGAPLEMRDHALRSVVTAMEMTHAVDDLRGILVLPGGAQFDIGIGVNTGPMVVGNMGPSNRFNFTVLGDSVNLASRLESLNKLYGTRIIISDSTYEKIKDLVFCRQLDTIQVNGKTQAVTIYEPMGLRRLEFDRRHRDRRGPLTAKKRLMRALILLQHGERRHSDRRLGSQRLLVTSEQEEIKTMYEHALDLFHKGDLDGADAGLDHILRLDPSDGPSRLMKERLSKLREERTAAQNRLDPVFKFE